MLQVYFDEGGTDDGAKIVVMAGFIASYRAWRKFERQWQKVLNPEGGNLVFHATDCMSRDGYKDFKGWSKQRRNELVDALIPVVKRHVRASVCCAFSTRDYEEVVPEWFRRKWRHPYYICLFAILNTLYVNRERLPPLHREKIAFVFARKPKFVGLLTDMYDDLKYEGKLFPDIFGKMTADGDPKEDIPIQAADLFCYLVRTFHERDYFQRDSAHPRILSLLNGLKLKNHLPPDFLDRKALQGLVRTYEETRAELGGRDWGVFERNAPQARTEEIRNKR
jgi:Protein of unknown function (DUF3800)